jgi:hypothetical protein
MHKHPLFLTILTFALSVLSLRAMDLKDWTVTGNVTTDASKAHTPGGAAIKVAPGAKAVKTLRSADGSGHVTLWVYDDMTAPADPKAAHDGPCWGLIEPDGQVLIVGVLYAGYLSGDEGYTAAAGTKDFYLDCQWTSVARALGWHKWDFDFDAAKGFTLQCDDKPVKFDWNKTSVAGFSGIVLLGDSATKDKAQTLWVDDVQSTLGGPMTIHPVLPPPAAPFLPATDPAATGTPVKLLDSVANQHPRLLITPDRIAKLKAFYASDKAALYKQQLESMLPICTVPENRKMTESWGQDIGLQKMPSVAMHYVLTGDKDSFNKCMDYLHWLAGQPDWTDGGGPAGVSVDQALDQLEKFAPSGERNSDTTASFTMVGAALTWDWLYNDMDPAFREQFRKVLWQHARVMYYGGHLAGNPGGGYWRGVPMYNHRWFRDWGLTLAVLATTEDKPENQWLLGKLKTELQFMDDWLPKDGSNHEGPGYGSSSGALGMAFEAADGCLGTHYLDKPFFKNLTGYAVQLNTPGFAQAIYFSDCFTRATSVNPYYLKTAALAHDGNALDGMRHCIQINAQRFGVKESAWSSLLSDDPSQGGDYTKLPTTQLFADLGLAIVRDSWQDSAVAAMFKCGPPGGYTLNSWRPTAKDEKGGLPYINVAHDHPDANSFTIFDDSEYSAETDRYPEKPGKLSTSINTILVNGIGHTPEGRPEGEAWLQPSSQDMTSMGKITAWKDAGNVVVTEGEASGSYLAYTDKKTKTSRPALDRFRRTFIWVKSGYILVLDDVRSPQPVDITWLMQGQKLTAVDDATGTYDLTKNKADCGFQLLSEVPLTKKMGVSTANDHSKLLGWQQLQATANGQAARFVSLFDPWHHKDLKLTFTPSGPEKATVTVTGTGISDSWDWQAATGKFDASTIHGTRKGGFDVLVNAQSAAPPDPLAK